MTYNYPSEMEVIDHLCGSDQSLNLMLGLFETEEKARRVLAIYVEKEIISVSKGGSQLP